MASLPWNHSIEDGSTVEWKSERWGPFDDSPVDCSKQTFLASQFLEEPEDTTFYVGFVLKIRDAASGGEGSFPSRIVRRGRGKRSVAFIRPCRESRGITQAHACTCFGIPVRFLSGDLKSGEVRENRLFCFWEGVSLKKFSLVLAASVRSYLSRSENAIKRDFLF